MRTVNLFRGGKNCCYEKHVRANLRDIVNEGGVSSLKRRAFLSKNTEDDEWDDDHSTIGTENS